MLLYVLLLALPVPVTAVTGAWLEGHPLTLLAGAKLGPFLAESHGLGATLARVHAWLGDAILWLAGLHALAALCHHFVLKDRVLRLHAACDGLHWPTGPGLGTIGPLNED